MTWAQTYQPLGNLFWSALVAALPVIVLLGLMATARVPAYAAALAGLVTSLAVAIFVYHMPTTLAGFAALDGAAYGLFPIGWIVLCAIFVYDITVYTGQFEVLKRSVAGIADDRRVQVILIAFAFGAFMEGAAGFGTPVAISAAMLIGLGFRPLEAATLSLIGNTAPVAFGALGTPILALAKVTGIAPQLLSAMVGRQLPIFSLVIPFWLVWAMAGWRGMREVWPACLTAGLSFATVQGVISNLHGPWIVDIAASIASMVSLLLLLKIWQPRTIWRFEHEREVEQHAAAVALMVVDGSEVGARHPETYSSKDLHAEVAQPSCGDPSRSTAQDDGTRCSSSDREDESNVRRESDVRPTKRESFIAWMPWAIVSVIVFVWGLPQTKATLNHLSSPSVAVPHLHQAVFRAPPVVPKLKAEEAVFTFNWLSATGTGLLLAGIISGFLLRLGPVQLARLFLGTLLKVRLSLLTISAMMAIGFSTRYGGLDATMGLAFASTGVLFPLFSPLLGWLGVALTGSDTSSNVLFGNLQQITAQQLGFPAILAAAANSSGGVMGKMIDAQSIVVASVATNQHGGEGIILRRVFFHSIALAILVGLLVLLQAYVLKAWIP